MYEIHLNNGEIEVVKTELKTVNDVVNAVRELVLKHNVVTHGNHMVQVHEDRFHSFPVNTKFSKLHRGYVDGGKKWLADFITKSISFDGFGTYEEHHND